MLQSFLNAGLCARVRGSQMFLFVDCSALIVNSCTLQKNVVLISDARDSAKTCFLTFSRSPEQARIDGAFFASYLHLNLTKWPAQRAHLCL